MRKPRIFFPGALYHVIARGNHRQRVFDKESDYKKYLSLLAERIPKGDVCVFAFCLMPNHVHLLIEQKGHLRLSRTMQRLQTAYTKYYNREYRKVGHLFQGRYQAILCDRDGYLLELVRYIHLNPWRARMEERVGQYPWTSHACYLGTVLDGWPPVEVEPVLAMLGANKRKAIAGYSKFISEGCGAGHNKELYETSSWQILGGEKFEYASLAKIGKEEKGKTLKIRMGIAKIWVLLKGWRRMSVEPRGYERSRMIEEAAYLAAVCGQNTQKEVAEYFGLDQCSISAALSRLKKRWKESPETRRVFFRWAGTLKSNK